MNTTLHLLIALFVCLVASCSTSPKPPAPDDWETEFKGVGTVPTTVVNASSRAIKLRLAHPDGTTAAQVQLNGNGNAAMRLHPNLYQVKVRIAHGDRPRFYRAPSIHIPATTASVRLTLQLASSTNLQEIDEAEFNH